MCENANRTDKDEKPNLMAGTGVRGVKSLCSVGIQFIYMYCKSRIFLFKHVTLALISVCVHCSDF
jgi:hypothetical protein